MERDHRLGRHIVYVDEHGQRNDALVTVWWGDVTAYRSETGELGCNLVIVSRDEAKRDSYGRQIEHRTSVVHRSKQVAHGNYWCWPDEIAA